jgi:hypothetical protein
VLPESNGVALEFPIVWHECTETATGKEEVRWEPSCGGTYTCELCGCAVGWCFGCDDPEDRMHNGICDSCWYVLYGELEIVITWGTFIDSACMSDELT